VPFVDARAPESERYREGMRYLFLAAALTACSSYDDGGGSDPYGGRGGYHDAGFGDGVYHDASFGGGVYHDAGVGGGVYHDAGYGGGPLGSCISDSDCASPADAGTVDAGTGGVCARDGECLSSSQIYTVHVTWTVNAAPASAAACAGVPDLKLYFDSLSATKLFSYSPVACMEGEFTVDKLPKIYNYAFFQIDGAYDVGNYIDATTGTLALDVGGF
jgi:hypothetical protein